MIFVALRKLYRIGLLTPLGMVRLARSIMCNGSNLMALLCFAARTHPGQVAISDEREEITYAELRGRAQQLAAALRQQHDLRPRQKIGILCRNHTALVLCLVAASRVGADAYLLNVEISCSQLNALVGRHTFDLIIHDPQAEEVVKQSEHRGATICTYNGSSTIDQMSKTPIEHRPIRRSSSGRLVVLTGGTTGEPKAAARGPSIFDFLFPFLALLVQLNLDERDSVYVATPIYHGFGVASLITSMAVGAKVFLTQRFDASEACRMIHNQQIEAVTVVPLMLSRMLAHNPQDLESLQCIVSGGAPLNPRLVEITFHELGDKLYNLYGTSEIGFSVLATPVHLKAHPDTIGEAVPGVKLHVLDANDQPLPNDAVGRICIRTKWMMENAEAAYIETGDLGYVDASGLVFLRGRTDDMIVSGGENVYPIELENALIQHPEVREVAVIGIPDPEFGQRLKAFVALEAKSHLQEQDLKSWLSGRVARFCTPKELEFLEEIPHTPLGKPDHRTLRWRE